LDSEWLAGAALRRGAPRRDSYSEDLMKLKNLFTRLAGAGLLATMFALAVAPAAQAEPEKGATRRRAGFDLLGAGSTWTMQTNRVQCGMDNQGNVCTDTFGSPTGGGGFWPAGSPNQYIFNSGLQIAGIVADDAPIWAGDTVGAYFFDARGTQPQGQQVTLIYSSVNPDDIADWPNGAYVRDPSLYNAALLGRQAISQEDTWVRYWDGPSLLSGRLHPMGILVEQRGLAWNYPSGNQDIVYFVYNFTNITASDASAYSGLDPAIRGEIAAIGADWVSQTESKLGVDIPSSGYRIDSVYAAFAMDPDVGNAGVNASTAILPFSMGVAYKTDFNEPTWYFPPEINGPPFGPYPGFVGVKYLKSPIDPATGEEVGLTLFSNTTNSSQFPDPRGVVQLWRYLSGNITPSEGDPVCDINPPKVRRLCALKQLPDDTRFYQASGPFSLNPGESSTIVVAYVHAAPIGAVVAPYFNGTLEPGIPPSGTEIATNPGLLRTIEYANGWVSQSDANGNGAIEQNEVVTVPRSTLQKALVAQSLFDAQFLLPFAPEAPNFYLVPGDNSVTVVWEPSVTEQIGDPYFAIASDPSPSNGLYDPNYRQFDVEGYRIYRGRTRAQLELIAQYDYSGTTFVDYTGVWAYDGRCAPELGITSDCPTFPDAHDLVGDISQVLPGGRVELAGGQFIRIPSEQVGNGDGTTEPPLSDLENTPVAPSSVYLKIKLSATDSVLAHDDGAGNFTGDATGTIDYLTGELSVTWNDVTPDQTPITASYGYTNAAGEGEVLITNKVNPVEDAGFPALSNTGVPYAYVDNSVANSVNYYYAVSAFDVNSVASGPGSLESPLAAQSVTPRAPAANLSSATVDYGLFGRGDQPLDPNVRFVFDGATGRFTGSPPPTDMLGVLEYQLFAPTALKVGARAELRVDSVVPGYYEGWYYMTLDADGQTSAIELYTDVVSSHDGTVSTGPQIAALPSDPAIAAQVGQAGLPFAGSASFELTDGAITFYSGDAEWHYQVDGSFWTSDNLHGLGGSRWFDGDDETMDNPTGDAETVLRGQLTGINTIYSPQPYVNTATTLFRRNRQSTWHAGRQADVKFYWGSTPGTLDSVVDVTDDVLVPFNASTNLQAGWGFRDDISGRDVSYTAADGIITEYDFGHGPCYIDRASWSSPGCETRPFLQQAVLQPVDINADGAADGNGFALYFNHEFYIFQTDALPSNVVWTHRSYFGNMAGSPGALEFTPESANAAVPGLAARLEVTGSASVREVAVDDLSNVHTVPDPYYVTSGLEVTPSQKVLKFVNLPSQAIIRIYSLSGILVDIIEHNDPGLGGEATWSVRNRNQQFVASGVYFYHIETPSGATKVGRFTVVNSKGIAVGQTNQ